MKKYEYKKILFTDLKVKHYQEIDINKLNEQGKDGWELVVVSGYCIFKREI